MKNVEKIITALTMVFTVHKVEISYNFNAKIYCIFIDDNYVGNFDHDFLEQDFDNPEIELFDEKVKTYDNGKFDGKFGEYKGGAEE